MNKKYLIYFFVFSISLVLGYFLFSNVKARPMVTLQKCFENCYSAKEIAGLFTSIGIQKTPFLIPTVLETDKALAIKSPFPQSPIHYIIFPKKDIKNAGDITSEDTEFIMEAYAMIAELIRKDNIKKYQIIVNGPEYQHTTYLHFHLRAEK